MSHARLATDRLTTGMATGIGSLPHLDAVEAAASVLRCLPELPCAPQLPHRSPAEGMLTQLVATVPEFTTEAHGGLLAFLDVAAALPTAPTIVKVQIVGPLTLGVAFRGVGSDLDHAFARSVETCASWATALTRLVAGRLPNSALVVFFDEPALVLWRDGDPPVARDRATELLSAVLAATSAINGIHVCGRGDVQVALDADPAIVHVDVGALDVGHADALARYLERDRWIAWGAVPTDVPIAAESPPLWERLTGVWSALERGGCDPVRLRGRALLAPACGLAGHDVVDAERAMRLARELGDRVRDGAAAPLMPT
jgi:hypothetical protein